jgi:hypothetical protein
MFFVSQNQSILNLSVDKRKFRQTIVMNPKYNLLTLRNIRLRVSRWLAIIPRDILLPTIFQEISLIHTSYLISVAVFIYFYFMLRLREISSLFYLYN